METVTLQDEITSITDIIVHARSYVDKELYDACIVCKPGEGPNVNRGIRNPASKNCPTSARNFWRRGHVGERV